MRRDDDVTLTDIDGDVAHLYVRQVQRKRLPVRAAIEGRIHGALGAEEEKPRIVRVLPYRKYVLVVRKPRSHRRPVLTVVRCLVYVWMKVIPHVARGSQVSRPGRRMRGLDGTDFGPLRQVRRCDGLPGFAAVATDVHQPVGRACPDLLLVEGRYRQSRHVGKDLRARLVEIDRAAARRLGRRVVACQIGADRVPAAPGVGALEDDLRGDEQLLRIVGREEDGMGPAEAVFLLSGGGAFQIVRPGTDVAVLPGREVVAQEDTEITAAIGDVRVPRLRSDEGALAVGDPAPVAGGNHTLGGCARALEGALVLLRAVDMEGKLLIQRHVVELARGLVVL